MAKNLLLGVCGGIAAYKSCELLRLFQKEGFDLQVLMTKNATEFIGPESFRALSHKAVALEQFGQELSEPIAHIKLADEHDFFIIAPATANCLAKLASGIADDLLTSTALAFDPKHIIIAPAMNVHMYTHPATQANIMRLKSWGVCVIEPESGTLACGYEGVGKLASLERIVRTSLAHMDSVQRDSCACNESHQEKTLNFSDKSLAGLHLLITVGPTHEAIDPVRYIANKSSGKMGCALALAALQAGASLDLICGPIDKNLLRPLEAYTDRLRIINVVSAREMHRAVFDALEEHSAEICICTAAVADFRPELIASQKIKKDKLSGEQQYQLKLVENPDILASLVEHAKSQDKQALIVGFAAETDHIKEYAYAKIAKKGCDLLIANDVSDPKQGFSSDNNAAFILERKSNGEIIEGPTFKLMSKQALAQNLIAYCAQRIAQRDL